MNARKNLIYLFSLLFVHQAFSVENDYTFEKPTIVFDVSRMEKTQKNTNITRLVNRALNSGIPHDNLKNIIFIAKEYQDIQTILISANNFSKNSQQKKWIFFDLDRTLIDYKEDKPQQVFPEISRVLSFLKMFDWNIAGLTIRDASLSTVTTTFEDLKMVGLDEFFSQPLHIEGRPLRHEPRDGRFFGGKMVGNIIFTRPSKEMAQDVNDMKKDLALNDAIKSNIVSKPEEMGAIVFIDDGFDHVEQITSLAAHYKIPSIAIHLERPLRLPSSLNSAPLTVRQKLSGLYYPSGSERGISKIVEVDVTGDYFPGRELKKAVLGPSEQPIPEESLDRLMISVHGIGASSKIHKDINKKVTALEFIEIASNNLNDPSRPKNYIKFIKKIADAAFALEFSKAIKDKNTALTDDDRVIAANWIIDQIEVLFHPIELHSANPENVMKVMPALWKKYLQDGISANQKVLDARALKEYSLSEESPFNENQKNRLRDIFSTVPKLQ